MIFFSVFNALVVLLKYVSKYSLIISEKAEQKLQLMSKKNYLSTQNLVDIIRLDINTKFYNYI